MAKTFSKTWSLLHLIKPLQLRLSYLQFMDREQTLFDIERLIDICPRKFHEKISLNNFKLFGEI